jgi:hypothetical protein
MFTNEPPMNAAMLYQGDRFSHRWQVGHSCPNGLWKASFCRSDPRFPCLMHPSADFTSPISASFAMKRVLQDLSNRFADQQASRAFADR